MELRSCCCSSSVGLAGLVPFSEASGAVPLRFWRARKRFPTYKPTQVGEQKMKVV